MSLTELLGVRTGDIVAIAGCNGKTSLLYVLAEENRSETVLLGTTTHIRRPLREQYDRVVTAREELGRGINLLDSGGTDGKLSGADPDGLCAVCPADGVSLFECDGSRGLPFKGWAAHEPVIPHCTTLTIGVCALWRLGERFGADTVQRPERFARLTGAQPGEPVTVKHLAAMVSGGAGMFREARGRRALLINQIGGGTEGALALVTLLPAEFRRGLAAIVAADLKLGCGVRID